MTVILKWVAQSQFAGYYAAKDLGYYDDVCLDVTVMPAGGNIVPFTKSSPPEKPSSPSITRSTRSSPARKAPTASTSPRCSSRGGYLQVAWADSGIETIEDLRWDTSRQLGLRQRADPLRRP